MASAARVRAPGHRAPPHALRAHGRRGRPDRHDLRSAQDAQDGNLSAQIAWSDLSTLHHTQPNATNAASYTFTASEVGRHPIRAKVTDLTG